MNEFEGIFRALDSKYKLQLVERIRLGVITDAASVTSYSLTLSGETTAVDAVPSVSSRIPQVGDLVRVALVGDDPVIVDVLGGPKVPVQDNVVTQGTTASTTYVSSLTTGGAGPTVTLDLVAGQTVTVTIGARISCAPAGGFGAVMCWAVSGAETDAANDDNAIEQNNTPGQTIFKSGIYVPGTTGSHTIFARYKVINAATGTFTDRRIIVAP